jgi:integrase
MTRDPVTKNYKADIKDRAAGRVLVSLRTTKKAEATDRYAALRALIREGDAALIHDLRKRRLNIEAVTRVHLARQPFSELRAATAWPALGEARDQYLSWIGGHPNRSENTYDAAKYELAPVVEHLGADTPLPLITHEHVAKLRQALEARGNKSNTVGLRLARLGALYRWVQKRETRAAAIERRIPSTLYSPVDPEAIPEKTAGRVRFLSKEETERVVAATPPALQLAVALGLLAGLRIGEILALRPPPHDIDLTLGVVLVQPKEGWKPKSKASNREVPIADKLLPILLRHVAEYANDRWLFPAPAIGGRSRGPGLPMSEGALQLAFRRIVADAGLVPGRDDPLGVTPHTLRHTFASWLVMGGVDLFTVARLMGHSSTKEVEEVYGHLAPEHRKLAVSKLNDQLAGAFKPYVDSGKEAAG